ncbi:MAG: insulinase family protein [Porticoccaceae bacterium]
MSRRLLSLFVVALLVLQGCSPASENHPPVANAADAVQERAAPWYVASDDPASAVEVLKSPADDRSYRYFTLDNGLEVLLVSDSAADKAAASLSIDIGSFENPPEREGLAHFLEHMLFLGTDKYPEPGEYQAFISEHGGTFNAYTSLEETNYFFDVDSQHLMAALDRFARFFVAPLFNPEYVDRERHAVDSEYQLKIKDDSRREWDVLAEIANPEHPFSRFSVGNLETLQDSPENPLRDELLDFYEQYYSASRMKLVVLGKESLDDLQRAVADRFADVPHPELTLPDDEIPLFTRELPVKVSLRPEKELRQLSFLFPMPGLAEHWRKKPIEYLSHLIGHEGEGSLLQSLKARDLAEGLSAGPVYDSRRGALFAVQISLTPKGVARDEEVSRDFFRWLELIRSEGIEQWRYDEVARLAELRFRFAEKQSPMGYVYRLSNNLHHLAPADILRGNYLYEVFDEALIERYASYLRPDNLVVTLVAPDVETDRTSRLYSAPYAVEPVDAANFSADTGVALSLPARNPYIAGNLVVHQPAEASPVPVRSEAIASLWHYPDSQFQTPKGYFEARIALPVDVGLEQAATLEYLLAVVEDQLNSEAYPAMLAGLGFGFSTWEKGFLITLTGYSEKQPVLLASVLDALKNPDWDETRLQRIKTSLIRELRNTTREWPLRQLLYQLPPLLTESWPPLAKAEVLEGVTVQQLRAFHSQIIAGGQGRHYAGGNYSEQEAQVLAAAVIDALALGGDRVSRALEVRDLARREVLPVVRYPVDHNDSAAVLYIQGDGDSLEERALFSLLNNILQAPFYNTLRTEKQLGYAVGSSFYPLRRVPGALFYVQSPKVDADALRKEIDGFLATFSTTVAALDEEGLNRYRQSVLANIEEKPRNINQLAARHLESLNLGYENFDFRPRLAEALRAATREQVVSSYEHSINGARAGLWLLTGGDEEDRGKLDEAAFEGVFSHPE